MVREWGNMPKHFIIQRYPDARREQGWATWPLLFVWQMKEDAITWEF